ncbi:phosphoribosyltransferase [Clostridium polyendosporum]|uniref:Phosphoribosyltransferase n=1 Tax=Clostridium polyendosporum TaxID=69208 RepID=A0A919RXD9_9CLOT|nr:phosphoribosyltransferase family protein [Clostridium polyendosporum]GIM28250.1 phosphoribosyltransferase [Clostridium polyendosporum]
MFLDRKDAANKLSLELEKYKNEDTIILAIPRGGIVTAYDTIKKFGFQWDFIIPRKIGVPSNKEYAIGAVCSDGTYFINEEYAHSLNISQDYIEKEVSSETKEIKRRLKKYRGSEDFPEVKGKTVIIVDDGIATGLTIIAAIKSIEKHEARKVVVAVPVAPVETIAVLEKLVDEVICLLVPDEFYAVGQFYRTFEQVTDEEVFSITKELGLTLKV